MLVALIVATIQLISIYSSYQKSARAYEALNQATLFTPAPASSSGQSTSTAAPLAEQLTAPITVDWETLQKQNIEIIAWLYCADTPINYPVAQCDNNDYYLTHNASKDEDESGSLFLDCRNYLSTGMQNLIIYGHRRNDLSMFGSLVRFAKKDYRDQHPTLFLLTPDQNYMIELFACRTIRGADKYFFTQFDSEHDYLAYIDKAISQSYWNSGIDLDANDTIITLATCSRYHGVDDAHLLLHGYVTPIS
ncbi:MAG: class B sortase [Christensenella sp.]|nr:class B sortase [Christensenella sp.]